MSQIKFNKLAQEIAKIEGKKEEVNIAQINEILKVALSILAQYPALDVLELLDKYK